jgi:hypothetical protein
VADPAWCGNSINKTEWKDKPSEGGWTLEVIPTWCGRLLTGMDFNELISKTDKREELWPQNNRNYSSTQGRSMYNQYRCHIAFVSSKPTYNLEPRRPLVEWKIMITRNFPYACNP